MIGTQENGLRILFSQGCVKNENGVPCFTDYKPSVYNWDKVKFTYVELRSFGTDYILESRIKDNYDPDSKTYSDMTVLNGKFETEAEMVRCAISLFDSLVDDIKFEVE